MKKAFIGLLGMVCLIVLLPMGSVAQYTITPIPPPPNFTFNDLWQLTVLRSAKDNYSQFYIGLRVFNEKEQLKVKSNSTTLALAVGSHYYNITNISDLQPFSTSYHDAALLQQSITSGGMFPPGTYNITYTLYGKAGDGEFTPLAEETIQHIVEVMWPPLLLWPEDESVISDPYPNLTWTPAFSSTFDGQITYELKLVELLKAQSKEQAIQSNPPYLRISSLPNTIYPYGASAPKLEMDHTYVWQVTADLGGVAAKSQVWQFTMGQPKAMRFAPTPENLFTPVTEKLDGSYHLAKSYTLKIKYTEEYELPTSAFLLYNIYKKNGEKIRSSLPPFSSASAGIKKGDNFITLSLGSGGLDLTADEYYILEVMNYKNEKWYLRFKVTED